MGNQAGWCRVSGESLGFGCQMERQEDGEEVGHENLLTPSTVPVPLS